MSFYLTLPSSASANQFPQNTATRYTTQLPRHVDLDGNWEVGLAEIILPPTKFLFTGPLDIFVHYGDTEQKGVVPYGRYASHPALLDAVRKAVLSAAKIGSEYYALYDPGEGTPKIVLRDGTTVIFQGEEQTRALGVDHLFNYMGPSEIKLKTKPSNQLIYVYCDIIEHGMVGDTMAPCLRTLSISPDASADTILKFENPHYVPLLRHTFSTVEIELADYLGNELQFFPGTVIVKLHFRPKKR